MKTNFIRIAFICLIAGTTRYLLQNSREYTNKTGSRKQFHTATRPGEKINGDQSAKKYAPGQQKKH